MHFASKIFKFLASLKLAVLVILFLGTICAWGTFVESKYNAFTAQKIVYQSVWMYTAMLMLITNLFFVIVDRYPWQKRHLGFILAHVGIITLILGSYLTQQQGLDGVLAFQEGESNRWVTETQHTLVTVYKTKDGENYLRLFEEEVDFFKKNPKESPRRIQLDQFDITLDDFIPYASSEMKIVASSQKQDGAALRFQLKNPMTTVTEWLYQPGTDPEKLNFGPLQLTMGKQPAKPSGQNEVIFWPISKDVLSYQVFLKNTAKPFLTGRLKQGEVLKLPWMKSELKSLSYFEHARREFSYKSMEIPTELSTMAVRVQSPDGEKWLGLNNLLKFFTPDAAYIVTFANRRTDIGFDLKLKKFTVGRYEGSQIPMSYQSLVDVPELGEHLISMNEPLKYKGLTFYQSSFQEDDQGRPIASVLSVNRDPGRPWKYFGSFLIVLGTIVMFYFKKKLQRSTAK